MGYTLPTAEAMKHRPSKPPWERKVLQLAAGKSRVRSDWRASNELNPHEAA